MEEVRINCSASCTVDIWEEKIEETAGERDAIMFTDGSKAKDGRVAGGWAKDTFSRQALGMEEDTSAWGQQSGMEKWREWQKR